MIYQTKVASQNGAVLVVSLIMLLLMTLIGISAMQSTVLEEKMAGNFKDKNIAFQAAESALRDAENLTDTLNGHTGMSNICTNGLCYTTPAGTSISTLEGLMSNALSSTTAIPGVTQPKYLIDGVKAWSPGGAGWRYMFRIIVQAEGQVSTTKSELRATYYPNK
jgi:type IV pilus assembly protein PilX